MQEETTQWGLGLPKEVIEQVVAVDKRQKYMNPVRPVTSLLVYPPLLVQ